MSNPIGLKSFNCGPVFGRLEVIACKSFMKKTLLQKYNNTIFDMCNFHLPRNKKQEKEVYPPLND